MSTGSCLNIVGDVEYQKNILRQTLLVLPVLTMYSIISACTYDDRSVSRNPSMPLPLTLLRRSSSCVLPVLSDTIVTPRPSSHAYCTATESKAATSKGTLISRLHKPANNVRAIKSSLRPYVLCRPLNTARICIV